MPTPRSESIEKARDENTVIREPTAEDDSENKIDHYSVLSQVINSGVDRYLSNPEYHSSIQKATSIYNLDANLGADIEQVVLATLKDEEFKAHHESLITSAEQRLFHNPNSFKTIDKNIIAGIKTFVSSTSYLFHITSTKIGPEVASNKDNWTILDKLAKLNLSAFSAYYRTYFITHENYSRFLFQTKISENGGLAFKKGYPKNAPVNYQSTPAFKGMVNKQSYILNEGRPVTLTKDVPLSHVTVGCPITFEPEVIQKLWNIYADQAYRIFTTPAVSPGDIEASHQ